VAVASDALFTKIEAGLNKQDYAITFRRKEAYVHLIDKNATQHITPNLFLGKPQI
jgi:hypothetical protein